MGINVDLGKIKFNWRGDWSPSTAYTKDDVVNYNGASVVCVADNTGQTPNIGGNTSYWNVMLKGAGSYENSGKGNPQSTFMSRQNRHRRYYDYSDQARVRDNVVNPYSLEQMRNESRMIVTSNASDSHWSSNPWNGAQMQSINFHRFNYQLGLTITVPAGTDAVYYRVHGGSNNTNQWASLTDPNTMAGVCYSNCAYDNRHYALAGHHTGGSAFTPFGEENGNNYYGQSMLMVPRLSYDKQYYFIRGHHTHNAGLDSWYGGFAFVDNPRGFVWTNSGTQYERGNGGDSIWHSSWNSSEMMQMYIHYDNRRSIKVPVAPQNNSPSGDRVLFFMVHGDGHDQVLKHIEINGKHYHLSKDLDHPVMTYLKNAVNNAGRWRPVGCVVAAEDIPSAVRTNGGCLDVMLDNGGISQDGSNSHQWYFGNNGTCYLEAESNTIDDGRTGRTTI